MAVVPAGAWVLFPFVVDLNQLAQLCGAGALAVGAAALVVAVWTARRSSEPSPTGDAIDQDGARAHGTIISKDGATGVGGDRISQRRTRTCGTIIGKQHHTPDHPHSLPDR